MKKYTIEDNDFGPAYLLHFEDDTYGLVNIEIGEARFGSSAELTTMGFWRDGDLPEIPDEVYKKIDAVLESLNGDYTPGYRKSLIV